MRKHSTTLIHSIAYAAILAGAATTRCAAATGTSRAETVRRESSYSFLTRSLTCDQLLKREASQSLRPSIIAPQLSRSVWICLRPPC